MPDGRFPGTRWSLVKRASEGARQALQELCEAYWYPLYAYVRRQGYGPEDAADLTQGFFVTFLSRDDLRKVRKEGGRFRSYLLAGMSNHLKSEQRRASALKRGGDVPTVSLDVEEAEGRYQLESPDLDAEALYHRRWTWTLIDRVRDALRDEYVHAGNGELYDALAGTLVGESPAYGPIAKRLGKSRGAVKVAAHRLRDRFRHALRAEVLQTVNDKALVDDEIRELLERL